MGACQFINSGRGRSATEVFKKLQEAAIDEYGNDIYNGTISTVPGFTDVTNEWKVSKMDINRFMDRKFDNARKYECFCVCMEAPKVNSNKTKTHVEHIVTNGTKKWVTKYVVFDFDSEVGKYNTKGDAVKAARAHTEKTLRSTSVILTKSIEKGNSQVARITYKRSINEKDGKYVFFGYAAE